MKKCRIKFLPDKRSIEVDEGTTLSEVAQRADIFINNLCGGEGVCGECRVRVKKGEARADKQASAFFSQKEIDKGFLLACQTEVHGDLEV
ncbi:MAG: 2Fe-2S iron-sulfur cluster-binding protein, partial [Desulfatiglandales bacterium]